jgi:hypothetical protein
MTLDSIIDIVHPFRFSEQMMYYTATIPPNDFYPDSLKVMTRYLKDIGKPEGGPLLPEYFQYYGLCGDALFCLGKLRCFETPDTFIQFSSLPCDTTFLFGNNDCLFSVNTNEHESTEAFEIYPNPVDDILYIISKQKFERFFIYDIHGNQILSSPNTLSLKISNLAPGTYLITAVQHSGQKTLSKLFIKL